MTDSEIISTIYYYYPKGIRAYDVERITASIEFSRRMAKCEETKQIDGKLWSDFKNEFRQYLLKQNSNFSDYTRYGAVPSYFVEVGLNKYGDQHGKVLNSQLIHIFISFIVPYWSFQVIETSIPFDNVSRPGELPAQLFFDINAIILKYFPNYEYLESGREYIIVNDVATPYGEDNDVTVSQLIFVE